jgi:hypothetical protein
VCEAWETMNSIQIADETFVAADPADVGRAVAEPVNWLHAEPAGVSARQLAKTNLAKVNHARRVAGKKMAFELKRTLEASRPVGVSRLA